jgi:Zn-dependent protease
VQLDWSLLIIFALIAVNLGTGEFPRWHPGWSQTLVWALALAAAAAFLISVLVHELAHALVARARGMRVPRITLLMFGGLTEMEGEPDSPASELLIAGVGPLVSLAIGIASIMAVQGLIEPGFIDRDDLAARAKELVAQLGPAATLLLWLGPVNLMLGLFNLVPGFPLDGGRLLRAALWWSTSDLTKATRWAAAAGKLVAYGLIVFGVISMFGGGFVQGLWLVFIGWFLSNAAHASVRGAEDRDPGGGVAGDAHRA